jgi:hypothetical protein
MRALDRRLKINEPVARAADDRPGLTEKGRPESRPPA